MTINTGNFSSIKPSVEVSVDVPAADTQEAYDNLAKIADALMALEFLNLSDDMEDINKVGWGHYRELLDKKTSDILDTLTEGADKLVMMEM
jgi:hypothetical protein